MPHEAAPPARAGIGLRAPHAGAVVATRPPVGWLEVHAENYMGGGPALRDLERIRRDYPIALHGVGLSLGTAAGLDARHLERLACLVERLEPCVVSEHLSWSVTAGAYLNHLLPLPYTEEALEVARVNVDRAQTRLGRVLLLENPSSYLRFRASTIPEPEFLGALAARTGCGILCDVNNVYVTAHNLGLDAAAWIDALPAHAVGEFHLAGHSANDADGATVLVDDHGSRVAAPVWALYAHALGRVGPRPTLVEWDSDLPPLAVLVAEARKADELLASNPEWVVTALRELQDALRAALLAGDAAGAASHVVADGIAPAARLAIYRHHVVASLTAVLQAAYPVVCLLVDERFFAYAAHEYLRGHPPASPCLFEYGASFPEFLAAFPPCAPLAYLPDVARLEWALHAAWHADDAVPLDGERLASVASHGAAGLVLRLHPSVSALRSSWPVHRVWRAHQLGADDGETVDVAAGGVCLEVRRRGDDVAIRETTPGGYALRRALLDGRPLGPAARAARAAEPGFDLAAELARLLDDGLVAGVDPAPRPGRRSFPHTPGG